MLVQFKRVLDNQGVDVADDSHADIDDFEMNGFLDDSDDFSISLPEPVENTVPDAFEMTLSKKNS